MSSTPSARRPVPRSKISVSSPQRTSTQEVFPPVLRVPAPGDARLPRTPQKRTVMTGADLRAEGFFGGIPATECRKAGLAARNLRRFREIDQVAGPLALGPEVPDV